MEQLKPIKLGFNTSPLVLILIYEVEGGKKRKYIMPLRGFKADSSIKFFIQQLKSRHKEKLEHVPKRRIERILFILQQHLKGCDLSEVIIQANKLFDRCEDDADKSEMEETFVKNRIKPGDPDYVYDNRVDFIVDDNLQSAWDD